MVGLDFVEIIQVVVKIIDIVGIHDLCIVIFVDIYNKTFGQCIQNNLYDCKGGTYNKIHNRNKCDNHLFGQQVK